MHLDECREPAQGRVRVELAGRHEVRKTELLLVRSSTVSNKGPAVLLAFQASLVQC